MLKAIGNQLQGNLAAQNFALQIFLPFRDWDSKRKKGPGYWKGIWSLIALGSLKNC